MTKPQGSDFIQGEIQAIAEYLGCNEQELWSEIQPLLKRIALEQRQDELDRMEAAALKGVSKPFTMYEYSVKRRKEIKETE